jgi:hypothetical protein
MKNQVIYPTLLVVGAVGMIFLLILVGNQHNNNGFTQLYFKDFHDVDTKVNIGDTLSFKFEISNKENSVEKYDYRVFVVYDNGESFNIEEGSVDLENKSKATFGSSFEVEYPNGKAYVTASDFEIFFEF